MGNNQKQMVLGDLVTLQRGTTYKSNLLDQAGPILLGLASIQQDGGFRSDSLRTYGGECPEKLILRPGDIYVSLKDVTQSGDLLGAIARVPRNIPVGRLTQDTVKLIFKSNELSNSYLYWLLRTPQYRAYCRARAIGTTNLSLSREDFLNFPIPESTPEKLLLVNLLDSLDDKIELNRKMNATLEELARAIFKSWFVEFDPVHAKAAGCQPIGMDVATAALFPSSFETIDGREVPQGWEIHRLDSVASYLNGLALQKFPAEGSDFLPVIKIAQMRKGNTEGSDKASPDIPPQYIVEDGDVLFSWSGSLEVIIWCGGRGALNQHLFKVTSENYAKWFYYLWTKHHLPEFQFIAAGKVTTMGHIQRHHLTEAEVVVPTSPILKIADKTLGTLIDQIVANDLHSRTLATLRDSLLPKLLSGEMRVRDAEHWIETVS